MNIDKRPYSGGMNMDSDPHIIQAGDYRYALNCIVGNDETGNLGAVSNSKGSLEITFDLPDGENRCIGSFYDSKNSRIFFFLYNIEYSLGTPVNNHGIYEIDLKTNNVNLLIESKVLNFDWQQLINDVDLVDDKLLYFTDGWNPPRKINIEKAKKISLTDGYSSRINTGSATSNVDELIDTLIDNPIMIVEEYFDAVKYAPYKEPLIEYFDDIDQSISTKVDKNGFQFKYKWIYDDGENSPYSPISGIKLQNDKATFFGDVSSIVTLDGDFDSASGTGSYTIQPRFNNSNTGKKFDEMINDYLDDNTQEFLANGDIISYSPFGHSSLNSSLDTQITIIPGGAGQVQGLGSYNNGVYTAPFNGDYDINISLSASKISAVDDNGDDISDKGLLKRFLQPDAATSRYTPTQVENGSVSNLLHKLVLDGNAYTNGALGGSNASTSSAYDIQDSTSYNSWTEVSLNNTINYFTPVGFNNIPNSTHDRYDVEPQGNYINSQDHTKNPALSYVDGYLFDGTYQDEDGNTSPWGDKFATFENNSFNSDSTVRHTASPFYNQVSGGNQNNNAGTARWGEFSHPPKFFQRVTHFTTTENSTTPNLYTPDGAYSANQAKAFNTTRYYDTLGASSLTGFITNPNHSVNHVISYYKYEGQADVDNTQKSNVQLFIKHQYSGGVNYIPITNSSGSNQILHSTSNNTTYDYSNPSFTLASGDKLSIEARRYWHVYDCTMTDSGNNIYKSEVGIGAEINNIAFDIEYDTTSTSIYIPDSVISTNQKKNSVRVTVQTGSELVKKIVVVARDMEIGTAPEFYKVVEIDKEELGLSDFHTYDIIFRNDKTIKEIIDVAESNRIYDFLPRISRTQEYLNNNRIAYGNILEGYNPLPKSGDSDEKLDVNLMQDYRWQVNSSTYSGIPSIYVNETDAPSGNNGWGNPSNNWFNFGASKGDTLTPTALNGGGHQYIGNRVQIIQSGTGLDETTYRTNDTDPSYWGSGHEDSGFIYDRNGIISPDTPTFKRGGRYTFGLVYFDRAGRASMVNSYANPDSPNSMTVDMDWYNKLPTYVRSGTSSIVNSQTAPFSTYTPSGLGNTTNSFYLNGRTVLPPNIFWEINHKPPKWATHYQWVVTKNENTDYFVQGITGGPVKQTDNTTVPHFLFYKAQDGEDSSGLEWESLSIRSNPDSIKYMDINIEHFYNYDKYYSNGKDEPILSYSYRKGDKIRFYGWRQGHAYYTSSSNDDMKYLLGFSSSAFTSTGNPSHQAPSANPGGGINETSAVADQTSSGVNIVNPNYVTMYWGHGLYKEYIEFDVVDVVELAEYDNQSFLRVTGDFSIFKQNLYFTGPTIHPHSKTSFEDGTFSGGYNEDFSALQKNSMFEIYRTKDEIAPTDKIFYEFGQTFRIGNPHSEDRFHMGELNDQDFDTTMSNGKTVPARGNFGARFVMTQHPIPVFTTNDINQRVIAMAKRSYGDTYTRNRVHVIDHRNATAIPTLNGVDLAHINYNQASSSVQAKYLVDELYVQDQHINDIVPKFQYTSGLGRPHIQNDEVGEEWRYSTVRFSDPMIEDSKRNQLNTFYESQNPSLGITSGFVDYEKDYGSIQKIIARDTDLIILHENKTTKALVSKEISTRADGSGNLIVSATPLTSAVPYVGDFGVNLNPESVAKFNNVIYYTDLRNGAVIRLSRDGQTRISENGMHKYFKDIARELTSKPGSVVNVYGEFNTDYNEYILTFDSALKSLYEPTPNIFLDTDTDALKTMINKNYKS